MKSIMSWDKLSEEVRKRRRELGLTQPDIQRRGGPGVATLLTTLVSLDPIYASFEVDEPTFLAFRQVG